MSTNSLQQEEWKPSINPWLITVTIMLATFMVALDATVANVALPQMAGTFSATHEEALWIITSYLVANGIILPTTAWFSSIFGRKFFLISCIIAFGVSSFLCGTSTSMEMIIFARILQGLGGGALLPISQAVLFESFPKEQHGKAMSVYGLGVILAPVIGPTLGGWITDSFSWNWIFFINIPVCIVAVILSQLFIEDPPYMRKKGFQKIDYFGFLALALWLGTLQIVLDNGQKSDWFETPWICWASLVSAISMTTLVIWELKNKKPLFDLMVFKNWNFTFGTIIYTVIFSLFYASMAILPLLLQSLLGYSAYHSGLAASPMGIGCFIAIGLTAFLAGKIDYRKQVIFGLFLLSFSCYMFGNLNLNISIINVILPNIILGCSFGFILVPLTTLTFSMLEKEQMTNASGIQNLLKSIGGAIGVSIVSTMIVRFSQTHHNAMVGHLSFLNPAFQHKLGAVSSLLSTYMNSTVAAHKANYIMYVELIKQANLCAYMDCYRTYTIIILILIPLVFIIKKVNYDSKQVNTSSMH